MCVYSTTEGQPPKHSLRCRWNPARAGAGKVFFSAQTNKQQRPTLRKKLAGTWRGGVGMRRQHVGIIHLLGLSDGESRAATGNVISAEKGGELECVTERSRSRPPHWTHHTFFARPPRPIARLSFVHRPSDQIGCPSPSIPGWAPHVFVLCAWTRSLCLFSLTPQTQGPRRRMVHTCAPAYGCVLDTPPPPHTRTKSYPPYSTANLI